MDSVKDTEIIHQMIGYMPQKFGLYEDLTVRQNLVLYSDLQGVVSEEREQVFEKLLSFTGLAPFTDRLARNLSGGMKQKLGLACTLIRKPTLLLLDEPSVGVDPISCRELWKMIQDLLTEGIIVLWSTAYLDEAEKCPFTILLNEGNLLYHGPSKDLTSRVDGRTFKIENIQGNRREVLSKALNQPNVIDGIIQGNAVRIVTKEKSESMDLGALNAGGEANMEPTPPRFEDVFIDILGGGPGGRSLLAEKTPQVEDHHEAIIETEGLTKKFGTFTAAGDVSFKIKNGEIFGFLGPNGAGKSTTFKMLCGLLKPTSGKAVVNGVDLLKAPSEARAHIGYMAQKFSLYGDLSVNQNLSFFSGAYNLQGSQKADAIEQVVEIFNFKDYLGTASSKLPL